MELKRKVPPNPKGNLDFRRIYGNLGESSTVRLPTELHSLFKDLTTAINLGRIKTTDLENQCIDRQNVERQLTALDIGKPSLEIVPPIETLKEGSVRETGVYETSQELKAKADDYSQKYGEALKTIEFLGEQLKKQEKQDEGVIIEQTDKKQREIGFNLMRRTHIKRLVEQFEEAQSTAWKERPQNKGEFSTDSPRWTKYNEFKTWLKNLA